MRKRLRHEPIRNGIWDCCWVRWGVVYGDIGTSPLYTLRECFHGPHALEASRGNLFGILSLVLWSLIGIVSVKYLTFVLRADNRGEGGILSLLALAFGDTPVEDSEGTITTARPRRHGRGWLVAMGVFGAALLYGDGIHTPSISVLSAMEGLEVASPGSRPTWCHSLCSSSSRFSPCNATAPPA